MFPIHNTKKQIRSGLTQFNILIHDCKQPLFYLLFLCSILIIAFLFSPRVFEFRWRVFYLWLPKIDDKFKK